VNGGRRWKRCFTSTEVHSSYSALGTGSLVKENLAASLRKAIAEGRLLPGQRVIEGKWAREFGVAQASVREAINLLISEGFVVKDAGRSARVVRYSEQDVQQIYEVRTALESRAAFLACQQRADLQSVEAAVDQMAAAVDAGDVHTLIESDLHFHVSLAEASENPLLTSLIRRLVSPLFAFVLLRVLKCHQGVEIWREQLLPHYRMVEIIREGDPTLAQQYAQHALTRFADSARGLWGGTSSARA
jgi:DNA-binding GntR family transcriptional regulator